ncbi:MAG: hypothetical protein JEZ07_04955 [Phycisphaerae bacterium]|nr:hypothetical protein [Phycisphaerae bacterium]
MNINLNKNSLYKVLTVMVIFMVSTVNGQLNFKVPNKISVSPTESKLPRAIIYYSDGSSVTGQIATTPGKDFKLNIPEAGDISTTEMFTGEEVKYGKVRRFNFTTADGKPLVKEIRFYPSREEMRQDWKFTEKIDQEKEGWRPANKEFFGELYPVRYLFATVEFNTDESLTGHLYPAVFYLKTGNKTIKIIYSSKQRGQKGETLEDLKYIQSIKLLETADDITAAIDVEFVDSNLGADDKVMAITKNTFIPLNATRSNDTTFTVKATLGEDVFIAMRRGDEYIVGFPETEDAELGKIANEYLQKQRDFYNDKKLLAVVKSADDKHVLTLLNLRRRHADTNFGKIGGEWDKEIGGIVEPWRLSIWRWKFDPVEKKMSLVTRGTFFREIFLPEQQTPTVSISKELNNAVKSKNKILVKALK